MATMLTVHHLFLIALVLLAMPPPAVASRAELNADLAHPASADDINHTLVEKLPHWLPARDAWLLKSPLEDGVAVDAVVSADGTGNYTTISAAVAAAPTKSTARYVVHIKRGRYKELVDVGADKWNLVLLGDGMEATTITGNRSVKGGYHTMTTATVSVHGPGFIMRDLTVENTAGAVMEQAVAFMSESNRSVVHRCGLRGYQDTLYAFEYEQFYSECRISGTVDFIFGDAAAIFQNCTILARLPMNGQPNVITAQARADATHRTGFTFQFCTVAADDELVHANYTVKTYLGRPWQAYSRVIFMQSYLSDVVHPDGWMPWNETNFGLNTCYYAEFSNGGPGANINGRVKWSGVHSSLGASEAWNFTVQSLIDGNQWLPATGVSYTPGLRACHLSSDYTVVV
ncbi:probable pectinesterase/pectinesterase inhibitor 32 [Phragmites australis]|uniref:probable pectinesterase/pectinesterase inhibitor 32 n=1 Tax=Phragmites australis TaxID=29695 RepID=UPI002D777AF9|nr:probable pectinesterase/pectinesterase inhibitor 32 [Phragmites australis]